MTMNREQIKKEIIRVNTKAVNAELQYVLIAWKDVLGYTSIRTIYAESYIEVVTKADEWKKEYSDFEHYININGLQYEYTEGKK